MNKLIKPLFKITIGTVLYAIGVGAFFQPYNIAPGGVSGIAIIINFLTNIPPGNIIFVCNIPLFIIAYKSLGKYFILTTFYAVAISSWLINFIVANFYIETEPLLAGIYGGIFLGVGLGLIFSSNSSTGGSDIVTRLIRKKKPHLSLGQIMITVDMFVVVGGVFAFGNINSALYAIIALWITTKVMDMVIEGSDLAKLVYIISDHYEEIAYDIGHKIVRGSTLLNGVGAYTKIDRKVIMCAVRRHQIPKVKEIVLKYDEEAFMIVTDVREVLGHGFKLKGKNSNDL